MNQVYLMGRVGQDAELRTTASGKNYVKFSLATARKKGEEFVTDWHRVTLFGKKAEKLSKGDTVFVSGYYTQNKWTDRNGQERETMEVLAHNVMVQPKSARADEQPSSGFDDIPF